LNPILKKVISNASKAGGVTAKKLGEAGQSVATGIRSTPFHSKVGLGMGATSFALGVSNYRTNKARNDANMSQLELQQKSLKALNSIHNSLKKLPVAPQSTAVVTPKKK
jgi:hypothetical protein